MKINNTVVANSNFQFDSNDKCKISNNGAIFQILSSKLYSDKFNSIVREISSNMYDSHKAANKLDVPFVINLNREFIEFKDFGVGLSEEEIDQIYKVYFNSTKSGDNNYIGGFGLGSKTPFAYTNIFNISSKKNGKKLDYICFMDDKFQPNIKKIGESEVDLNDTGFTVKFNIANESDYESFLKAIQTNFDYYKVKPIFNNQQLEASKDYNPKKILSNNFEYENFRYELLFSDNIGYWDQKINIIVGNIKYDVSLDALSLRDEFSERIFYNYVLNIYIPVGSISLTVNREKIEYDKNTITFLTNCLKKIQDDLVKQLLTIYTTEDNLNERRLLHNHLGSIINNSTFENLRTTLNNNYRFTKYYYNGYSNRLKEYFIYHIYDEFYSYYNNKNDFIVYDDINFGKNTKILKLLKAKLKEKEIGYFYVLRSEPTDELRKLIGISNIIKISDFLGVQYEECIKIVKKVRNISDSFRLVNYFSGLQKIVKEGYIINFCNTKIQKNFNRTEKFLKEHLGTDLFIYDKNKKSEIQELVKNKKLRFIMNDIKFSDLLNLYDGFLKNMHRYIETCSNYYQDTYRTKQVFSMRDFEEYMKYIDCIKDDKIQEDSIFVYNHLFNAYSPLNNCIFEQRTAFYNKIKSVLNQKIENIKKYYALFLDLKYHKINSNILNNLYQTVNLNGNA